MREPEAEVDVSLNQPSNAIPARLSGKTSRGRLCVLTARSAEALAAVTRMGRDLFRAGFAGGE